VECQKLVALHSPSQKISARHFSLAKLEYQAKLGHQAKLEHQEKFGSVVAYSSIVAGWTIDAATLLRV
jgi:hypothetical protein